MVKRAACVMTVVLVALFSPVAMGALFINPPETYASPGEWVTPFPYQRNAMIDFSTDPSAPPPGGWPTDPANPLAYDLLPGLNYDLEGTRDLDLFISDWLQIDGNYAWMPSDPWLGSGRTGILLFNNPNDTPMPVSLTWHFDNLDQSNSRKDMWSELIWLQGTQDTNINILLTAQPGYQVTDLHYVFPNPIQMADGWLVDDGYGQIVPNPEWEEATLQVLVAPHDFFAIDSWHTATECVPEPGTCALFGMGLMAILIRRRRRDA